MKIRVINGFYDVDKHRIIEKDEVANYGDSRAKELISLGLAIKATEGAAEAVIDEEAAIKDAPETPEEKTEKKAKK